MKRDVAFFRKLKIIDYSLLIGVHDTEKVAMTSPRKEQTQEM